MTIAYKISPHFISSFPHSQVNGLSKSEIWALDITDAEGAVTKLPQEFMSICTNSVPAIKEITSQANDHEHDVLADPDVVASFKELLLNAMSSFAFTLEFTAGIRSYVYYVSGRGFQMTAVALFH